MLAQYRITGSYRHPPFLAARIGDKAIAIALLWLMYWGSGNYIAASNLINISALLYMLALLPTFAAFVYIPSMVQERALFNRCASMAAYGLYYCRPAGAPGSALRHACTCSQA